MPYSSAHRLGPVQLTDALEFCRNRSARPAFRLTSTSIGVKYSKAPSAVAAPYIVIILPGLRENQTKIHMIHASRNATLQMS